MKYYEINEELAKRAKQNYSFSDYVMGSETQSYQKVVDGVYQFAEAQKLKVDEKLHSKIDYLADKFAKKYADWLNKKYRIDCYCPSIMITGGSNFPVHKKEKQNRMIDNHYKEFNNIMHIKKEIENCYIIREEKQGTATADTFDNDYFEVVQNETDNRLQLFFEGKPDEGIRNILKSNGYKWSGKNGCWQRQLTDNARYNLKRVIQHLNLLLGKNANA